MKKQSALLLTFFLSFSVLACSTQENKTKSSNEEKSERTVAEKRIQKLQNFGDRLDTKQ